MPNRIGLLSELSSFLAAAKVNIEAVVLVLLIAVSFLAGHWYTSVTPIRIPLRAAASSTIDP